MTLLYQRTEVRHAPKIIILESLCMERERGVHTVWWFYGLGLIVGLNPVASPALAHGESWRPGPWTRKVRQCKRAPVGKLGRSVSKLLRGLVGFSCIREGSLAQPFPIGGGRWKVSGDRCCLGFWPKGIPAGRKPLNLHRPKQGHQSAPASL